MEGFLSEEELRGGRELVKVVDGNLEVKVLVWIVKSGVWFGFWVGAAMMSHC